MLLQLVWHSSSKQEKGALRRCEQSCSGSLERDLGRKGRMTSSEADTDLWSGLLVIVDTARVKEVPTNSSGAGEEKMKD